MLQTALNQLGAEDVESGKEERARLKEKAVNKRSRECFPDWWAPPRISRAVCLT